MPSSLVSLDAPFLLNLKNWILYKFEKFDLINLIDALFLLNLINLPLLVLSITSKCRNWNSCGFFFQLICFAPLQIATSGCLHIPPLVFWIADIFFRCKFSVECDVYHCPRTICPWVKRGTSGVRKKEGAWDQLSPQNSCNSKTTHSYVSLSTTLI